MNVQDAVRRFIGRQVDAREVYSAHSCAHVDEFRECRSNLQADLVLRFFGASAEMRGQDDVFQSGEFALELFLVRLRLHRVDVKRRTPELP